MLHVLRKRWIDGGGTNGMVSSSAALAARITRCYIGGRRSQPCVYLYVLHCAETTGRRAYVFCEHVATSLRTPVSPEWYCGAVLWRVAWCFRLLFYHWRNQFVARLSACSKSGAASTRSDLIATAWRNARILSKLLVILSVVSHAVTSFADIVFTFTFLLSFSYPMSSSASNFYVAFSAYCSLIFSENIFSSSSAAVSLSVSTISVRNVGWSMVFLEFQSWTFFDFTRFPAAAWRSNYIVRRWIFSPISGEGALNFNRDHGSRLEG